MDSIAPGASFHYAGVSLGGATGLQLGIKHGDRLKSLSVQCTGAKLGTPEGWLERAETVRTQGTPVMIQGSAQRWFAPGFMDRQPELSSRLLHSLRDADRFSYAFCCEALAGFDVRDQLGSITRPHPGHRRGPGQRCPAVDGRGGRRRNHRRRRHRQRRHPRGRGPPGPLRSAGPRGRAAAQPDHLDRIQRSSKVTAPDLSGAAAARAGTAWSVQPDATSQEIYDGGMVVRREVLGAEHVDRANAAKDSFTEDFQDMITRIAWGGIWTRPGLTRQMRSAVTITAMVAHGHWEELAMHIRAAINNGLSRDEIKEILLQTAIYCGVPSANTAFKTAQQVFQSMDTPTPGTHGQNVDDQDRTRRHEPGLRVRRRADPVWQVRLRPCRCPSG